MKASGRRVSVYAALLGVVTLVAIVIWGSRLPGRMGNRLRSHPVRDITYWSDNYGTDDLSGKTLILRTTPLDLLSFLDMASLRLGGQTAPGKTELSDDEIALIQAAIDDLPSAFRSRFNYLVTAIVPVASLPVPARTISIFSNQKQTMTFFIAIQREILQQPANEWFTKRESSLYELKDGYSLNVSAEPPETNYRRRTLLYVFLHEIGHMLAYERRLLPRWDDMPGDEPSTLSPEAREFFNLSWMPQTPGTQRPGARSDDHFAIRARLNPYGLRDEKRPATGPETMGAYDSLIQSDFPTMMASTSPDEDVAESIASYVHSVLLGRSLGVSVLKDGKQLKSFNVSCWTQSRCSAKRSWVEHFLKKEKLL